jgi:hypothetical protein
MGKNQHVVPTDGGWGVRGAGNKRLTKVVKTQKSAYDIAREIAKGEKAEVIIHGKNGRIRDKNSFGNDPFPPKG